jgi:hypothetical protein
MRLNTLYASKKAIGHEQKNSYNTGSGRNVFTAGRDHLRLFSEFEQRPAPNLDPIADHLGKFPVSL